MKVLVLAFFIVITLVQYRRYRDILCPAVMMNIMWIFAVLGTGALLPGFDFKIKTALTLIVGSLLFQIGFAATSKGEYYDNSVYRIKPTTLKWLVIVLLPFFAYSLNSLYVSMLQNAMYEALTEESVEVETIGGYFAKIIQYLSIIYLILFYRPENESIKKQIKPYIIVLCAKIGRAHV